MISGEPRLGAGGIVSISENEPETGPVLPVPEGSPTDRGLSSKTEPVKFASTVRLRFSKSGDLRLISHHDLMRCLERIIRRANLPITWSQGFNPRPRIVFGLALALGVEGEQEVVDLELSEPLAATVVLERLQRQSPEGLSFLEAQVSPTNRSPQVQAVEYSLDVPEASREAARISVTTSLAAEQILVTRRRPDQEVRQFDLRPHLLGASVDDRGTLWFRLAIDPNGSARPEEVLEALGLADLLAQGAVLRRTKMELIH